MDRMNKKSLAIIGTVLIFAVMFGALSLNVKSVSGSLAPRFILENKAQSIYDVDVAGDRAKLGAAITDANLLVTEAQKLSDRSEHSFVLNRARVANEELQSALAGGQFSEIYDHTISACVYAREAVTYDELASGQVSLADKRSSLLNEISLARQEIRDFIGQLSSDSLRRSEHLPELLYMETTAYDSLCRLESSENWINNARPLAEAYDLAAAAGDLEGARRRLDQAKSYLASVKAAKATSRMVDVGGILERLREKVNEKLEEIPEPPENSYALYALGTARGWTELAEEQRTLGLEVLSAYNFMSSLVYLDVVEATLDVPNPGSLDRNPYSAEDVEWTREEAIREVRNASSYLEHPGGEGIWGYRLLKYIAEPGIDAGDRDMEHYLENGEPWSSSQEGATAYTSYLESELIAQSVVSVYQELELLPEAYSIFSAPIADTSVSEYSPDTNFGDGISLYLQSYSENNKNERILLKFDLSEIPADFDITQAKLYLYCWRGKFGPMNVQCYSADDGWDEQAITWKDQPGRGEVLDAVYLDNATAENKWHSWDVTSFVRDKLNDRKVVSLLLKAEVEDSSGLYAFESNEWWDVALRPYLEIDYTPPEYSASILPREASKSGLPGAALTYTVRIANRGSMEDGYTLRVSDTLGWNVDVSPGSLSVPLSGSRTAVVTVTAPEHTRPELKDSITVTAVSNATREETSYTLCARTAGDVTETITPIHDTTVSEGYPDNNFGRVPLYLSSCTEDYKNERIFLKFDLSQIPENLKIKQARLYLYCWNGEFDAINALCHPVENDDWSERTLTWNNQPSLGGILDSVRLNGAEAKNKWYSWNVTSFVASESERDEIASFCIRAELRGKRGLYAFDSSGWWDASVHPYLEITYASGSENITESLVQGV